MDLVTIKQFGEGLILGDIADQADITAAQTCLKEIRSALLSNNYDLVILDEANVAVRYKLINLADLIDIMEKKPKGVELIITGRNADPAVIDRADLVTEMREIKHYEKKGVRARRGIEY